MTARLVVFLQCDAPECVNTYYMPDVRVSDTREAAALVGWRSPTEVTDFCPEHA